MHLGMLLPAVWLVLLFGLGKLAMLGVVAGGGSAAVRTLHHFAEGPAAYECGVLYVEWRDLGCVLCVYRGGYFVAEIEKPALRAGFSGREGCKLTSFDAFP